MVSYRNYSNVESSNILHTVNLKKKNLMNLKVTHVIVGKLENTKRKKKK